MADLELTFVSQDCDHTRALFDGRVKADGIELSRRELFPSVTFDRREGPVTSRRAWRDRRA